MQRFWQFLWQCAPCDVMMIWACLSWFCAGYLQWQCMVRHLCTRTACSLAQYSCAFVLCTLDTRHWFQMHTAIRNKSMACCKHNMSHYMMCSACSALAFCRALAHSFNTQASMLFHGVMDVHPAESYTAADTAAVGSIAQLNSPSQSAACCHLWSLLTT